MEEALRISATNSKNRVEKFIRIKINGSKHTKNQRNKKIEKTQKLKKIEKCVYETLKIVARKVVYNNI